MDKKIKTTNKSNKKSSLKIKRISIFTTILIAAIVAIVIGIYLFTRWLVITIKYKEYTDTMNNYGYNTLYNNGKASAIQSVKNEEVIKVVLGVIGNQTDISKLYFENNDISVSENEKWLEYAKSLGLQGSVNSTNLKEKATRIDSVIYAVNVVEKLLNIETQEAELKMRDSKLNKFTADEKTIIAKAVALDLIKNSNSSLSDKAVTKGELNKIIVTLVQKYATVYYKTTIIDDNGNTIKQNVNIVTTKENMPKNYKEYPYIVDSIEKGIYELDYKVRMQSRFKTPKEVYEKMGYLYSQTDEMLTRYFNAILNVDYSKITVKNFLESIQNQVTYKLDENDVIDYVNYVKDNKIKLEGKATPLLPIMYNNGEQYVVRTKIEFKVISAKTTKNLLYADEAVEYNSNDIVMYVDVLTGTTLDTDSLRVYVSSLAENISLENSSISLGK